MIRSLNEVFGMVLKASRGAGVPLGHCEDLAAAAGYIAATDPQALGILADVLAANHDAPTCHAAAQTMQINCVSVAAAGPLAVDAIRAGYAEVRLLNIQAPVVVFALFASQGYAIGHRFEGTDLIITPSDLAPPPPITAAEVTVSEQLWQTLNAFAAKTYVPATDASRLAGAGAGLTDND